MKYGGREAKQGMPPLIIGSLVLVLEMGMVVVRMVLDCGDDDDEKKKVVGSWFVRVENCGCFATPPTLDNSSGVAAYAANHLNITLIGIPVRPKDS